MTPSNTSATPASQREFQKRLEMLIDKARQESTPTAGAYSKRDVDPEKQDYNIEITKVVNSPTTESNE